ncbi:J domain-containing protein [Sandaracinus amylolyticus]|uniref:J domain-containing protein n=1 Tax=Sandaracinus amylolyticus TaxID=927083 RepID=UPI001F2A65EF|nr:J domain-containing protein [Sandaracinus amylolyticus]UJR79435.1 Heat shock protein DnaJ domain protein [Sandaracinus amylolyticus]
MSELPAPMAQGDLAKTPFAHAVLYCHQRELTGTLVVWPESAESPPGQERIRFEKGALVAARLTQRAGALDRGLLPLFSRASGPYAFYADVDLVGSGDAVRTGRVDPMVLLAASLRGPSRDDVVESVLAGFGDIPVRLKPGVDLRRFELLPKESAFVEVIRAAPAPVRELAAQCELGETLGKRLLYLFAVTKSLEPYGGATTSTTSSPSSLRPSMPNAPASERPRTPVPPASASSSAARARKMLELELPPEPPAGLAPEHLALWRDVTRVLGEIDRQSYFEMLGITKDAGAEAVRKAYFGLVKKWHPDRVPGELATLKPFVERIFHQLTSAQDTLCDDKKRGNYTRVLSEGGGTPESERKLAAVLQAAMDHQKAEVLIRRRDFVGAIELLRGAIVMSPEDADAHATLGWAMFQAEPGVERAPEMLASVDTALALNSQSDRGHFYRAMILRRLGRENEAVAAFAQAAALNPKNLDAVREVRLAQMRGGGKIPDAQKSGPSMRPEAAKTQKPATQSGAGLFSKIFGKKD